ncbi:MAG: dihydrolipoamide acetyltransferase family protein [Nitrolancea sp.]
MAEFRMPSLGADMESGRVMKWLIKPGDRVKRGDIVAEVETQKGVIDVEIFDSGEVTRLLVQEGDEVPVGAPIALLNGAEIPTAAFQAQIEQESPTPVAALAPEALIPSPTVSTHRIRISPAARRLAEEFGVDIESITGTGLGGAISRADIRAAAAKHRAPVETIPDRASAMRDAIAAAMTRSKREIPHYYLGTEIDMKRALDWLATENFKRPVTERVLPAALLLKAVALAVHDVPEMNGFWRDGHFEPNDAVHVGVGISLRGGGLVAPALHDVDQTSVTKVMAGLLDLVQRARSGKLTSSEIGDPTITVSNLGDQGVQTVYGVIYPPQVALVGFGAIIQRPWAENGMLGIRPVVSATLSADHRASVGHRGGLFLSRIAQQLQKPEDL